MWLRTSLFALLLLVLGGTFASAQTVNPRQFQFDHDDYALTDTYEVGYYMPGGTLPVQTVVVAKTAIPPAIPYTGALPRPILGTYFVKLRACAGTLCSGWSNATEQFVFAPLVPVNLAVLP